MPADARADRSLLPTAVDEFLRFDTPAQMFERGVLEDVGEGPSHGPRD